jgi:hypothetical protein
MFNWRDQFGAAVLVLKRAFTRTLNPRFTSGGA